MVGIALTMTALFYILADTLTERLVNQGDQAAAFSVKTESGSLVFDSERRAVGFIVGGGRDPDKDLSVSFVHRDFATLANHLGELFGLFFRRKDK